MKNVQIITDGACQGNPGPGGWAAILRCGAHKKELFGWSPHTTNNRMEIAAAIEGLRTLKEPCLVEVVTDSEYLKKGITEWIHGWKRKGWITTGKKPVLNRDLWQRLDGLAAQHQAHWVWTRGHAGHAGNNRADELATRAARERIFSKGYQADLQSPSYDLPPAAAASSLFDDGEEMEAQESL